MNGTSKKVADYFSLVKFSHTVFALPFAIIGFSLATVTEGQHFSFRLLVLILLCMVFARNAAMGFNRIADRRIDALNPRTARREIPAGVIKERNAILFVIFNAMLFIAATAFINRLTLFLSPVALLIILGYSLTKRITILCHFILGLGLSLAPVGAYISVTGRFALLPVIYSVLVLTWVSGFDIIYALQDEEFDKRNNLFSIPAFTGRKKAITISVIIHLITFLMIILAGIKGESGVFFWIGAVIFSLLLTYQHLIVKPGDISKVNLAFATTNGVASILFAVLVVIDLFI